MLFTGIVETVYEKGISMTPEHVFYFLYLVMYNSPNAVLAKDGEKKEACFGFHVVNILMRDMFPKI